MTPVVDKIISCPSLPSLPAVAIEILELTRDPNVSIKEIAKVVENDQAIAAKVLRTINSSYYGLASPCPTIQRAMGYLGLNSIRSLVLGFSLVDSFKGANEDGGFDLQAHWRRALYGATSARTIADRACRIDPDEAFIASMLQDVGMLAASMALGQEYDDAIAEVRDDHYEVERVEHERFGFTHSEVGALLAEKWRLPQCMVESVRHHHSPEKAPAEFKELIQTVTLSTLAAESLTVKQPKSLVNRFKAQSRDWFQLPADNSAEMLTVISDGASELSRLFQLDTGQKPDVSMIMAEAQEQQIASQISIEQERQTLETTATALEKESLTDGLTGIANRKQFDQLLDEAYNEARRGGSVAVIFMDADKFKSVNDTHGHQAGDEVLVELAARAVKATGDAGVVCRYGGEEFAVIAPGADRITGSRIAESIRKSVEATTFDLTGVPDCPDELPITISCGVAAVEQGDCSAFASEADLLKAADTAVYAAKKGGRNCTKVFNPRKASNARPPLATPAPIAPAPSPAPSPVSAPPQAIPMPAAAPAASPIQPAPSVIPEGPHMTVLLVEDDLLHASLLKTVLARIEHIDTCVVGSGEEALELLGLSSDPDEEKPGFVPGIMLCDLSLPGMTGKDTIRRIRMSPRHSMMPLIVISASETTEEAKACIEAGANAFLPKSRFAQNPTIIIANLIGFWTSAMVAA